MGREALTGPAREADQLQKAVKRHDQLNVNAQEASREGNQKRVQELMREHTDGSEALAKRMDKFANTLKKALEKQPRIGGHLKGAAQALGYDGDAVLVMIQQGRNSNVEALMKVTLLAEKTYRANPQASPEEILDQARAFLLELGE